MSRRIERVNELLRQEISHLLTLQIKDPRLDGVITITRVTTTSDLRNARVYISAMGNEQTKKNALAGIQSAAKFLRRELRERLTLRYVPFFSFALDDSLEHADRLMGIMNQIQESQIDRVAAEIIAVEDSQSSPASTNSG